MTTIRIVEADVLTQSADAILVPIDGTFAPSPDRIERILGNIGRQFVRRFPDAGFLDEIEAQVDLPVALGEAAAVQLSEGPFQIAILVSTLHHAGHLDLPSKRELVRSCFGRAMTIAGREGVAVLATPVLQGGWRLAPELAFTEMVLAQREFRSSGVETRVCCIDPAVAARLRRIAEASAETSG